MGFGWFQRGVWVGYTSSGNEAEECPSIKVLSNYLNIKSFVKNDGNKIPLCSGLLMEFSTQV